MKNIYTPDEFRKLTKVGYAVVDRESNEVTKTLDDLRLPATNEYDRSAEILMDIATLGRLFFIVGGPKAAKSFFTYYLTFAISEGTSFLGIKTLNAATVAYFDTEMLHDDFARRELAELQTDSFNVYLLQDQLTTDFESNLKMLREYTFEAVDKGAQVIVIDCLYNIIDVENKKEIKLLISFLKELASKKVLVIGVHHLNKGKINLDKPFENAAGRSELSRSMDTGFVLREIEGKKTVDSDGEKKAVVEALCISRLKGIPTQQIYQEANGKHEPYIDTTVSSSLPATPTAPAFKPQPLIKSFDEKLMEFIIREVPCRNAYALSTKELVNKASSDPEINLKESYIKKEIVEWCNKGFLSQVQKESKEKKRGRKTNYYCPGPKTVEYSKSLKKEK